MKISCLNNSFHSIIVTKYTIRRVWKWQFRQFPGIYGPRIFLLGRLVKKKGRDHRNKCPLPLGIRRSGPDQFGLEHFGLGGLGSGRFGLDAFRPVPIDPLRFGLAPFGLTLSTSPKSAILQRKSFYEWIEGKGGAISQFIALFSNYAASGMQHVT